MFLRNHIEIRRKTHMTLINAIKCVSHIFEHTKDINIYHCGSDLPKNQVQYNTIQQKTQRIECRAIVQLRKSNAHQLHTKYANGGQQTETDTTLLSLKMKVLFAAAWLRSGRRLYTIN
jgi:hypothetical protein